MRPVCSSKVVVSFNQLKQEDLHILIDVCFHKPSHVMAAITAELSFFDTGTSAQVRAVVHSLS